MKDLSNPPPNTVSHEPVPSLQKFPLINQTEFLLSSTAPVFSKPLRDSRIDPQTNSVFFSCQLASPPRLPVPELLYQRSDVRKDLEELGLDGFDLGSGGGAAVSGGVAAAWYLSGCLLSEAPGIALGANSGGWLWLRLEDAERGMAGKVVECIVRSRNGKTRTRARILLPGE